MCYFSPCISKDEINRDGVLGKVQYIYSNRLNLGTFRTDENVFWSFAPHDIPFKLFFDDAYKCYLKRCRYFTKRYT